MKRNTTIVLFASIFAVAVGTIGISGTSANSLVLAATPQTQDQVGMLGHVEYKILDSSGAIKQYMQGDNVVVNDGEDCVAEYVFGVATTCSQATAFDYIGIGNGTSTAVDATNATLADATDDNTGTCAATGVGGDMARRQVTPSFTAASGGTGTIVELDTSSAPFTFDASNATTVIDSGVFNDDYDGVITDNKCANTQTANTHWEMFSRQLLNGATGITVNNGDSLSVKWTITVG